MGGSMRVDDRHGAWLAELAETGQRRALEQLVQLYLPLVYNILGYGLSGTSASEDDVTDLAVQTTVRVAKGARPDDKRMRAWFAAAAVHRARRERPGLGKGSHPDFVDVAIARLELS